MSYEHIELCAYLEEEHRVEILCLQAHSKWLLPGLQQYTRCWRRDDRVLCVSVGAVALDWADRVQTAFLTLNSHHCCWPGEICDGQLD